MQRLYERINTWCRKLLDVLGLRNQSLQTKEKIMAKKGLYANIHAKRKRIKAGSKEKMRKPGSKGAPTAKQFKKAAKTAKKKK